MLYHEVVERELMYAMPKLMAAFHRQVEIEGKHVWKMLRSDEESIDEELLMHRDTLKLQVATK